MILALEYTLRTGALKSMVKFPVSIMLEHKRWDNKIVVTISAYDNIRLIVKHWLVSKCENQFLPSFEEFIINTQELYTSDRIILQNYYMLKFTPSPYLCGRKQYSEPLYASEQEMEYNGYINNFYNPPSNKLKRLNWLWEAFCGANSNEIKSCDNTYAYPYFGYRTISDLLENQRNRIKEKSKKLWISWLMWRRYMFDFVQDVSPELLFQEEYYKSYDDSDKPISFIV